MHAFPPHGIAHSAFGAPVPVLATVYGPSFGKTLATPITSTSNSTLPLVASFASVPASAPVPFSHAPSLVPTPTAPIPASFVAPRTVSFPSVVTGTHAISGQTSVPFQMGLPVSAIPINASPFSQGSTPCINHI